MASDRLRPPLLPAWLAPVSIFATTMLAITMLALALNPATLRAEKAAVSARQPLAAPPLTLDCAIWSEVAAPRLPRESTYLNAISALSSSDIWAVGVRSDSNTHDALTIHWNGTDWKTFTVSSAITNAVDYVLNDVHAIAANDVWAVGYYITEGADGIGRTLVVHWDGAQWSAIPSPNVSDGDNYLVGVYAVAANDIWAVGDSVGAGEDDAIRSLIMHWDGVRWSVVPSPNVGAEDNILYRVAAASPTDVWAVGFYVDAAKGNARQNLTVRWNGTQWEVVPSPNIDAQENTLVDLSVVSANDVWVVGYHETETDSQPTVIHWDGREWKHVPTPGTEESYSYLLDVAALASNDIWAVGGRVNEDEIYEPLSLHWDGTQWSVVASHNPSEEGGQFYGMDTVSATEVWAVGYQEIREEAQMLIERTSQGPCVTPTVRPTSAPRPTRPPATSTPTRPAIMPPPVAVPGSGSSKFPQTGKTVRGVFLDYWKAHGGLAQQGYPISELMGEVSELNGKVYSVQYFERAVFEYHPENKAPFNVLLSQLGRSQYMRKYPRGAPNQKPNTSKGSVLFKETGKRVGGRFLSYWQKNGGLAQQGYPLSDEFVEVSETNGKPYTVQYFERAVFEYHPENKPPHDVLLSLLGTAQFNRKYGGPQASGSGKLIGQAIDFPGAFVLNTPADAEGYIRVSEAEGLRLKKLSHRSHRGLRAAWSAQHHRNYLRTGR